MAEIKVTVDIRNALRNVGRLDQEMEGFDSSVENADRSVGRLDGSLDQLNSTGVAVGNILADAFTRVVEAAGQVARQFVETGANFEQAITNVGAISGATASELQSLEDTARELGSTTIFSATQAAEGLQFLAQAGFTTEESISALPGILSVGTAAGADLAEVSDIASNVLSGFNIAAEESGRVGDVLTETFTSSNTNIQSLGESFRVIAPVAQSFGFSIEETAAAVGRLGDAGIQGSIAGTQLRSAITRLSKPSQEAQETLSRLGISVSDAEGNFRSLPEIVGEFERGLQGLTQAERQNALATVVGQEALSSFSVLLQTGQGELEQYTQRLRDSEGAAQDVADQQKDTVKGAFKELISAYEGLQEAVFEVFQTDLKTALQALSQGLRDVTDDVVQFVQLFYDNFRPIAGIVVGVTTTFAAYRSTLLLVATAQRLAASGSLTLTSALRAVRGALISTGIGALIVAVGTLGGVLATNAKAWMAFKQLIADFYQFNVDVFSNLPVLIEQAFNLGVSEARLFGIEAILAIREFISDAIDAFPEFTRSVGEFFMNLWEQIKTLFSQGADIVYDFFSNPLDFDLSQYEDAGIQALDAFAKPFEDSDVLGEQANKLRDEAQKNANILATTVETTLGESISNVAQSGSAFWQELLGSFEGATPGGDTGVFNPESNALGENDTSFLGDDSTEEQKIGTEETGTVSGEDTTDQRLQQIEQETTAAVQGANERINAKVKELDFEKKAAEERKKLLSDRIKQSLQLASTQEKTAKGAAQAVANNIRNALQAYLAEAVAGAVSKTLASAPFPLNIGLAAAAATAASTLFNAVVPEFATGVTNFRGGNAIVGEEGPELVNLPRGSNVITNENTNRLLQAQERQNNLLESSSRASESIPQSRSRQERMEVQVTAGDVEVSGENLRIALQTNQKLRDQAGV